MGGKLEAVVLIILLVIACWMIGEWSGMILAVVPGAVLFGREEETEEEEDRVA